MTTYALRRQAALGGPIKEQGPFKSRREAATAAFYVLWDNRAATKPQATKLAGAVEDAEIDVPVSGHGYTFVTVVGQ